MYRSPSPFAPENPYQQPQSYNPSPGGQIAPGSVTYTTSTGPDGRVIYHPFNYQTPNGIVSGIQWVPAEATQILPAGAQPANSDFAASWNRGGLSRDDQKTIKDWQRDEERRRRREEKESARRLRDKERMGQTRGDPNRVDPELDLRRARERDAQAAMARERRKRGAGGTGYPASGYPSSPYAGTTYSDRGPPGGSPYGGAGGGIPYAGTGGGLTDLDRQFNDLDLDRSDRDPKAGIGRPRKYSTSEAGGTERARAISGNMGHSPYGASGPYVSTAGSQGPYSNPRGTGQYPPAQYAGSSPAMRPGEAPFVPVSGSTYNNSGYPSSPSRTATADPYARSTTPFGSGAAGQPRGHGIDAHPRSRGGVAFPTGPVTFPTASPRIPDSSAFPGEKGPLAAPEGFSRPINAAQPYTPFEPMKIQDMDSFLDHVPRMPAVLQPHDVYHEDWIRFVQDLGLAWQGQLPVPDVGRGNRPPRRATLVADLVDLWNGSFFIARGVEVVLYKGRERRSGPTAGAMDLPYDDDDDSLSSSSSSSSTEDSDDDGKYGPTSYGIYGRPNTGQGQMGDVMEARRRRREARAEKRRRRRERKIRRKAKAREKRYTLYLTCVHQGGPGATSSGMPGGFNPGMPDRHGGGYAGSQGAGGGY
ncbi:hypothetical protein BD779DRAFT_1489779 [Infundibulicybe gibba]|nr:hypothetical protein BD779DRAFT_1489779 [Infundibulicybe gibba]